MTVNWPEVERFIIISLFKKKNTNDEINKYEATHPLTEPNMMAQISETKK